MMQMVVQSQQMLNELPSGEEEKYCDVHGPHTVFPTDPFYPEYQIPEADDEGNIIQYYLKYT